MSSPQPGRRPWWRLASAWWWRSLPLRVILTVFVASVLVLVLGGFLLMRQATTGVLNARESSVRDEALQAINTAQLQINGADLTGDVNVDRLLTDLAFGYANRTSGSDQYEVVILTPGQTITAGQVAASSIPSALRSQVAASQETLMMTTEVSYRDGKPSVPGLVVGSQLELPGIDRYPIYFVFPLAQERETLNVLRNAVVTTGSILVLLLTFIAALVSRQVVTPVRAARQAAESLASGNLDDRMEVRGTDDLARLATSMNNMASELQKQITQLEELSSIQQRFVSDVSHELRTPLTTVRMAAEVLHEAREDFDPVAARSAELLQNEVDRFESLLTDLLEISRFDAGAAVLALSTVDLRDVVAGVVEANSTFAVSTGTQVNVHAPVPCTAAVDARRIERIVRNLLVNAIEHGEGRPIDIWMDADEAAVAIAVRDHGVGFEANQASQVFLRFWRGDPARARTIGGTGLGLAISMEDANLHGGWLTAWGRPGLGAQFRLTLPRTAGDILQQSPLPLVPRDLVVPSPDRLEDPAVSEPTEPALRPPPTPLRAESQQETAVATSATSEDLHGSHPLISSGTEPVGGAR
ncbi:MAG TPA: MtrAB system histidine kinase MtrB [Propionibacteriaceae bacterium]|nr:MtrAB system histidine kinase MtrB [Propionibacteriaceae bacterium]